MSTSEGFACWCGEVLTAKQWATIADDLERGCGGTGYLHCWCGGDLCACHLHGGTDCDGCEDCGEGDEDEPSLPDSERNPSLGGRLS